MALEPMPQSHFRAMWIGSMLSLVWQASDADRMFSNVT